MAKRKRKTASLAWDTTMMLDYAIEHYGLEAHNDPFTGDSTREAWMRKIQRELRTLKEDTKHGGRGHHLPERDAKRFIEIDMLDYFKEWAKNDDAVRDGQRLAEAEAEDGNRAEIMARRAEVDDEWARETEGMVFPLLDADEMRHMELRSMLQALIYEMTNGERQFDVAGFEADYRELNDLKFSDYYDLEPKSRVEMLKLEDRLANPVGSYLKPISSNGDQPRP